MQGTFLQYLVERRWEERGRRRGEGLNINEYKCVLTK
jgi:hypothetical protein